MSIAAPAPSVVPTRYWHRLDDGRVQCDLCPRACRLHEGQRGLCFVRMRTGRRGGPHDLRALERVLHRPDREEAQELQPKMTEIREKYKKDPQKMQQEMSALYKKHKVNPIGGCLPMLLQIPVFFALYKVLLVSIELRGAPFLLWITYLSAPDALFGHIAGFSLGGPLPYLMGITMVIQQKMTPSTMDPKQAKLMMLMPVIFTFMFLNLRQALFCTGWLTMSSASYSSSL